MKLLNVPFVTITFSTVVGILLGYYLALNSTVALISFFVTICLLGVSWHRAKMIFSNTYHFTLSMCTVFIFFGVVLVKIHNPTNYSNHYTNQIDTKSIENNKIGIQFYIKERLKPTVYYNKYIVSIKLIDNKVAHGKILLRIPKDSLNTILDIGESYSALITLKPIPKPLNPNQFDYASYLSNSYIFHQINVLPDQLINNHKVVWSLFRVADQIRKNININLANYSFDPNQLSIINALILGQRQDISQETFNTYRDAGAIHILAVSGLHVGIILLILNSILKPLERFRLIGKTTQLLLTIALLWCFAIIAGLSPSVLRAVAMFSFLAIGMQLKSKTSIYNSLFISMFILLCFNPLLLFSVGFQLSYLAVFAIVWIQPILANRYHPKFYISKKLWETFTVTIAAQLGLLPLTLFYFHQFPGLFFVSNLIIIPFLGGILGFGIVIVLLSSLDILPQFLATLFGACIDSMNTFIGWIAQQETFLITNISFSWKMLITVFLVIIASIKIFQKYERRRLYWIGASIIMLFLVLAYEKHHIFNQQELIIFHNQQNTTLGVLEHQKLKVYSSDSISNKNQRFLLGNYLIHNQANLDTAIVLKNIYQYKNQTILVIDNEGVYRIRGIKPNIIILSGSPKIHLDRIIDSLHPIQIIADGSNYKSYVNQWEVSCEKQEIPFHRTDKKGAFILK